MGDRQKRGRATALMFMQAQSLVPLRCHWRWLEEAGMTSSLPRNQHRDPGTKFAVSEHMPIRNWYV